MLIQMQICHQADANFPVKILAVNVIILYDMGVYMSCMPYACNVKLKDPPSLEMVPDMSKHSATYHNLSIMLSC